MPNLNGVSNQQLSQWRLKKPSGYDTEAVRKSGLIHFYNQLEELAEASYLINQKNRKNIRKKKK